MLLFLLAAVGEHRFTHNRISSRHKTHTVQSVTLRFKRSLTQNSGSGRTSRFQTVRSKASPVPPAIHPTTQQLSLAEGSGFISGEWIRARPRHTTSYTKAMKTRSV